MIHITLVCAMGMSTSMMTKRMKDAAEKEGVEAEIIAMSYTAFEQYTGESDVLLLGPQVSHLEEEFKTKYEPKGIHVMSIDMMDYGMMNGAKVLYQALDLVK